VEFSGWLVGACNFTVRESLNSEFMKLHSASV